MGLGEFIGTAGGLLQGGGGIFSAAETARQAKKQRKFVKKMYKRRYQYTMADMRKAGLNPTLAYQQGAGSSMGSPAAARISNPMEGVARSARTGYTASEEKKNLARTGRVLEADAALRVDQAGAARAAAEASRATANRATVEARVSAANQQLLESQLPSARARAEFDATPAGQELVRWSRARELEAYKSMGHAVGGALGRTAREAARAGAATSKAVDAWRQRWRDWFPRKSNRKPSPIQRNRPDTKGFKRRKR